MVDLPLVVPIGFVAVSVLGAAVGALTLGPSVRARDRRTILELEREREAALNEARASHRALKNAYRSLRALTVRLECAKEEERRRLAREIHDELGTNLTATKLLLELIAGSPSADDRDKCVTEAVALVDRMIGLSRALSIDLRPPLLDELGLPAALREYVANLSRRARVAIDLDTDGVPHRFPYDAAIVGFRVVQESLTNVVRHAGARHAAVSVRFDAAGLHIRVSDDGKGFDVAAALESTAQGERAGLAGMRERIESMGGEMKIRAAAGHGTRIEARLPVGV